MRILVLCLLPAPRSSKSVVGLTVHCFLFYTKSMSDQTLHKLKPLLLLVIALMLLGTVGFMYLDSLAFTDALLRVILLFSTLGFSEATTQTLAAKWFTIVLAFGGLSVIVYTASTFFSAVIEGELRGSWNKRMTDRKLTSLQDHIIICGFGRVGRQVAEEMAAEGLAVVIVDREDRSDECVPLGYLFLQGDAATHDDVLKKARIDTARAVIITMGHDSESLATAVTARALNPDVFIVARAATKQAESRLNRVGVDRVALPAQIGGYHMATMALRPSVVDFLDLLIDSKRGQLQIEQFEVNPGSGLIGGKVSDFFSPQQNAIVVLALYRAQGSTFLRPTVETRVQTGDRLILMGTLNQLNSFMAQTH